MFNLPELIALCKESADIQIPVMLKLPVPEADDLEAEERLAGQEIALLEINISCPNMEHAGWFLGRTRDWWSTSRGTTAELSNENTQKATAADGPLSYAAV